MAWAWGIPSARFAGSGWLAVTCVMVSAVQADVPPADRTADLPDSWLVLYNLNSADSIEWAQWYADQWGIPASHLVGLDAATTEHLPNLAAVQSQVIGPVRDYLAANPEVQESVMGIVLGYALPGHYDTPFVTPSIGGYSVADALTDMTDDLSEPRKQMGTNYDNPHCTGQILPPGGRLTRATMAAGRYMSARIDAPTLDDAKALTLRAKVLAAPDHTLHGDFIWYDYYDPGFPSTSRQWYWLRAAVENPLLAAEAWAEFDIDGIEAVPDTPSAAFRFAIYKLFGWSADDFVSSPPGNRVLGFHYNSFGAVTVRSLTDPNACYVPNALAAGFAAAIGATGEPQLATGAPFPDTLVAALREGWTLGEAYYLANPHDDWMWNLVGDPFLTLPNWFDEIEIPDPHGDINGDDVINERDLAAFRACMSGIGRHADPVCAPLDFDDDEDVDLWDLAGFQRVYEGGPAGEVTFDHDEDGQVDVYDFNAMLDCMWGPGPSSEVFGHGCYHFDADFDLDVDLRDVAAMLIAIDPDQGAVVPVR
ncbi:MAG: TIGR03790 family protein [Phycisphaerae bacterium]|nr:TIGR03790 family protein [Phycisphaerae bacterium]